MGIDGPTFVPKWLFFSNLGQGLSSKVRAGGAGPTTPTLVGPKISPLLVKFLHLESFGRTNNCYIKFLLRWSDQSYPPSATPESWLFLNFLTNFTSWLFLQNVGPFKQEIHLCPCFWLFWLLYFHNFVQILFEKSLFN